MNYIWRMETFNFLEIIIYFNKPEILCKNSNRFCVYFKVVQVLKLIRGINDDFLQNILRLKLFLMKIK